MESPQIKDANADRRSFLTNFGKAAVVAPPVITALLSTSLSSPAIAKSTGGNTKIKSNNGLRKGGSTSGNPGNGNANGKNKESAKNNDKSNGKGGK